MYVIFFQSYLIARSKSGSSPAINIASAAPLQKTRTDEFLNADNDTADYDW